MLNKEQKLNELLTTFILPAIDPLCRKFSSLLIGKYDF